MALSAMNHLLNINFGKNDLRTIHFFCIEYWTLVFINQSLLWRHHHVMNV